MKKLSQLITEDKVVKATCPRCDGNVTVPQEVSWVTFRERYLPAAYCHRCGVDFYWNDLEHHWYADRVLEAPQPTVSRDE